MMGLVLIGTAQGDAGRRAFASSAQAHEQRAAVAAGMIRSAGHALTDGQQAILSDIHRQLLAENQTPSPYACPECASQFVILKIGAIYVEYCPRCKGCWFNHGELMALTGQRHDVPSYGLVARDSKLNCPQCGETMRESQFRRNFNLLVDRCPKGHGIFLADGELERALRLS